MSTHAGAASGAFKVNSLVLDNGASPLTGTIVWDTWRSLWNSFIFTSALVLAPLYFSWGAWLVFLTLSAATLCAGHSVGFHRRLIHRSFKCSKSTERFLVWMGTIVGIGGPFWTIRTHDTRDWSQRQPACHDYLAHRQGLLKDAWYNLHCKFVLDHPPGFNPGPEIANDRFYQFLEKTWMLQQLPIGIALYLIGGMPWLVWGVSVRVAACTTMHWFISYFAHTRGPQTWEVDGAGVQAHDVPIAAIPTFGESWHNNHHAFPASARHGLYPGQIDLGWHFIQLLQRLGLAWDVNVPSNLPPREGITALKVGAEEVMCRND
ncbi:MULTISPECIES: acyl-CoA desaturase [unclassified Pseudomonas]|uniref:acyl-CoA desaturase n=1 Tax=unclassified Pseudomonas TaxID=196821 RepID=UPI000DA7827D|nr:MULTISPECIES: acyl-CoA desaturase [unclassified Pseudomonas]MDW3713379.1 acyl-CoA desaturase [Pseudomonas sp. 2023EL-01195]PZE12618.1 acyl-CoA desaturase [Pseudomonas sp. 57B-090624]